MRIKPETRKLLDMAAEVTGTNLTDFVLDAARKEAQSASLDRAVIIYKQEGPGVIRGAPRCARAAERASA